MAFVQWERIDDAVDLGHVSCTEHGQLTDQPVPNIDGTIIYQEHYRAYHATLEQVDMLNKLIARACQVKAGTLPRDKLTDGILELKTETYTIPDSPEGLT